MVDEVAVEVLVDHDAGLGLHPRRHEGGEVALRDALHGQLLLDQAHRGDRQHGVLRDRIVGRALRQPRTDLFHLGESRDIAQRRPPARGPGRHIRPDVQIKPRRKGLGPLLGRVIAEHSFPGDPGRQRMNSFGARSTLTAGDREDEIYRLDALQAKYDVARLPYALKVLLENLLRNEDGNAVRAEDIEALAQWVATDEPSREIAYTPTRVLLQDFTGVPAVVDLAAMRDAMRDLGGDAARINPLQPAELVIDHSVQVDEFATRFAFQFNA